MKKSLFSLLLLPAFLLGDSNDCYFDDSSGAQYVSCEEFEGKQKVTCCDSPKIVGAESRAVFDWFNTGECVCKYALEFRVGGTQPSNSRINRIYGSTVEYELEWAWRQIFYCFDAWINVSYLSKLGHVGDERLKSRLRLFPLSFGLKRSFYFTENLSMYVGLGASYTFAQGHFFSDNHYSHNQSWGFVAKSGFTYNLCNGLFLDLFGDYYYTGLTSHSDTVNVGGFRGGIGIGMGY